MSAPKGNEFWKLRTKHGRDKLFSDPEILWEEACKYFQWCEENPILKTEEKDTGKNVMHTIQNLGRPYTWEGLELFLDLSSLRKYKTEESHKDFIQVITRIEKTIYSQKYSGAATGKFNSNIIARDLGLTDKTEAKNENTSTLNINISEEGADDIKDILGDE